MTLGAYQKARSYVILYIRVLLFLQPSIIFNRQSSTLALGLGLGFYQQVILVLFPRIPALAVVLPPSHIHKL